MTTPLRNSSPTSANSTAPQGQGATHGTRAFAAADLLRQATWITTPFAIPAPGDRPAYTFRTQVTVPPFHAASIAVTSHGIYEAFVNGVRVGDQELTPGFTSYGSTLYVQQYDLAGLLQEGQNELRFVVSDGWFRGRCGPRRFADNFGTEIGVISQLRIETAEGPRTFSTDASWEVASSEITTVDLMDGQQSDLRRISQLHFVPVARSTDPLTKDFSRLAFSPSPPVRRCEEFSPVRIWRLPSGRQLVDFGQNLNGWIRLRDLGSEGTRTVLSHGEWVDKTGDLTVDHLAYLSVPGEPKIPVGQVDSVISRGCPEDIFEPRHTTHGFRYVAVDGLDHDIQVSDITAIQVRTDLDHTGSFSSSSERVNELHRVAVASWRANTCDVPTDCPQRERWGYTGDFQIFARSATFLDDIRGFSLKWLRSLADDQKPSGCITNVAPLCGVREDPKRPISFDGSAGWGDAATIIPWELYRAYGDSDILDEFFPMMSRWVDYATELAASGRHASRATQRPHPMPHEKWLWDTGWQWGEWAEPGDEFDYLADKGIVATAYLARSATIVADSAAILGRAEVSAHYRETASRAAEAWRTEYLAPDGSLTVETQANYVRGLALELIPTGLRPAAAARLVELIAENGYRLSTGFLSTGMLLPVLAEHGYPDVAYRLLFQSEEPGWMTMLDRGGTTLWESWSGVDSNGVAQDSLNHYSKGAVIAFLHEYVAGLRPLEPGYARFLVAPVPGAGIDACTAEFLSPFGLIRTQWTTSGDDCRIAVTVPAGTTAVVRTPHGLEYELDPGFHELSSTGMVGETP